MEKVIKNILVPMDFSNSSEKAMQLAIAMCKRHDASLHLLKVNKENNFPYPSGKNALLIGIRLESRVAELQAMESLANQLAESHHIKCYYHVEVGSFFKTIAEVAENFYCDLIVVEKEINSKRFSLSFDRDVCMLIKTSSCPVMTVPGTCLNYKFKSILFPIWVKRSILSKLKFTLPIIEKNSSKVILFGSVKSTDDIWEFSMLNNLMSSVRQRISLTTGDIENEVEKKRGTAKRILKKAVERNSDLIVISASANTGLLFLGNSGYTRFIINNSMVPVLSVK
ncbi:MAG: universal stress protein [Daejeonella sp.]